MVEHAPGASYVRRMVQPAAAALAVLLFIHGAEATSKRPASQPQSQGRAAEEVLEACRTALGLGESTTVQTLRIEGEERIFGRAGASASKIEIVLQPPGAYTRTAVGVFGKMSMSTGFDGGGMFRRQSGTPPPGVVISQAPVSVELRAKLDARMLQRAKAEATRLAVAFLLSNKSALPFSWSYVGRARSVDGEADVVGLDGPEFAARLYVHLATRRPVRIDYEELIPPPGAVSLDADPVLAAHVLYLDDYKKTDGMWFPRRLTRARNGATLSELLVDRVTVRRQ